MRKKRQNHLKIIRIRKLLTIDQEIFFDIPIRVAAADGAAAILVALTRRFEM